MVAKKISYDLACDFLLGIESAKLDAYAEARNAASHLKESILNATINDLQPVLRDLDSGKFDMYHFPQGSSLNEKTGEERLSLAEFAAKTQNATPAELAEMKTAWLAQADELAERHTKEFDDWLAAWDNEGQLHAEDVTEGLEDILAEYKGSEGSSDT
jgi:hypothetical protein